MRLTARLRYGLDALVDLAAAGEPVKGEVLAGRHAVSVGFLENILAELRRAGMVQSRRGGHGGYWLARPPDVITVADVMRALDGGDRVETGRDGTARDDDLLPVWRAIAEAERSTAASFTLAALAKEHRD